MNALDDKDLETAFTAACRNRKAADAPDLWPGIEAAITRGHGARAGLYRKLGFAGAFAAVAFIVLGLAVPGFTQNAIDRIKRLFRGDFSLSLGGKELSGVLISEDGEEKEIKVDGNVVKVRMSPMYENSVLIKLAVYLKNDKGELKLVSKPSIVTLKGKQAEIKVTGFDGKEFYKFRIKPEADTKTYRGDIIKVK